jgi:hypothetical protein
MTGDAEAIAPPLIDANQDDMRSLRHMGVLHDRSIRYSFPSPSEDRLRRPPAENLPPIKEDESRSGDLVRRVALMNIATNNRITPAGGDPSPPAPLPQRGEGNPAEHRSLG